MIRCDWIPAEAREEWTSIKDETIRKKLLAADRKWETSYEKFQQDMNNLSELIERLKKGASRGDPIFPDGIAPVKTACGRFVL